MQFKLRRLPYYAESLIILFRHVPILSWPEIITRKIIRLRKLNLQFRVKTLLDLLVFKEVVIDREYESYGVKVSKSDRIIIDIGAGFGDFSISIAKRFPQSHIFAFEPDTQYFALLQKNIARNRVVNIIPVKEAISSLGQLSSHLISSHLISSHTSTQAVDFMKVDCEGCEFAIIDKKNLQGLKNIKKLIMEYHESDNHSVKQIQSLLTQNGFRVKITPRKDVLGIGLLSAKQGAKK